MDKVESQTPPSSEMAEQRRSVTPIVKAPLSDQEKALRARTMRLSYVEGCFAMVMVALVEAFYIPYLNAMGATPLQIGLGASLPALVAGFVQLYTPLALYRSGSRKQLAVITILVQSVSFIPFGLFCHLQQNWAVWPAIGAFLVSAIAGSLGAASWADWMANVVPRRRRGRYFANRNRVLGAVQLSLAVAAGFLLDHLSGRVMIAFTGIWFLCFVFRGISGLVTGTMYEPQATTVAPDPQDHFWRFLRDLPRNNFGRFAMAVSLLSLSVNFAGPFFAVHMLNNLKLSYTAYTVLNVTTVAATIVFLGLWGRIIDRLGAVLPLRLTAVTIALIPLPWVLFDNYLVLLATQFISGWAWSGFNLAVFVFYLDAIPKPLRINRIAQFNALNAFCVAGGATLGGWLGPLLPVWTQYPLQMVFVVSAALRLVPAVMFQFLAEQPTPSKLSPLERLFFDPRLTLRTGVARSMLRLFKRGI